MDEQQPPRPPEFGQEQPPYGPPPQQPPGVPPQYSYPSPPPRPPKRPSWFDRHKVWTGVGIGVAVLVILSAIGSAVETSEDDASNDKIATNPDIDTNAEPPSEPTVVDRPKPKPEPEPEPDPKPAESVSQQNARETAQDYLDMSGFSRSGLIEQLKFEGYSPDDAAYGVDSIDVNWNEQAARTAQDYLDTSAFSRSGLIEQLKFEGYTRSQAEYGATQAGL